MDDHRRPDRSYRQVQRIDVVLVSAAQNGDPDALNTLMTQAYPRVLRFLMRRAHDQELARDLTQETLWLASQRLAQLTAAASFEPWLLRIARNTHYESRDQPRFRRPLSLNWLIDQADDEDMLGDLNEEIESYAEREAVRQALAILTPSQREVMLLSRVDGYSGAEVAVILGITPPAGYQRLHRALVAFQHAYKHVSADPAPARLKRLQWGY